MREGKALSAMLCLCDSGARGKKSEELWQQSVRRCSRVLHAQDVNAECSGSFESGLAGRCDMCGRKNLSLKSREGSEQQMLWEA